MAKRGVEAGSAVAPKGVFPTSLNQLCQAVRPLIAAGVQPSRIHLAGTLRVAISSYNYCHTCFTRARMSRRSSSRSHSAEFISSRHWIPTNKMTVVSASVRAGFPEEDNMYAEPVKAPEQWFKGVDRLVERVLITLGEKEGLKDDIISFGETFKQYHRSAEVVVQEGGIHEDMFLDFMVAETKLGTLTPLIIDRLVTGCTSD
ncbi:hypothetical protein DFH08DRAFT_803210 [Mycena albidolilacea]|uniref:Uncharacterized protein n=1 Tax=Mycena albidolilacea TaxID=1033008 RepID=A0AAD7ACG8_9AGAR|nr:hypothetical protein DFH08DRAFT_803210 [Mycena albidolilacea]